MAPTDPSASSAPSTATHAVLVLPFTPALLADPAPLLPLIYETAQHSADTSFTVLFSTPGRRQLYAELRAAPSVHFAAFQGFLGKVYAALAAGQWRAERVLLDVEVRFDGELGDWNDKLGHQETVLLLDGYPDLASDILTTVASSAHRHTLKAPSLPAAGVFPTGSGKTYAVGAVGGTFDHLHAAHKLLLHMSLFISSQRLVVGVVADKLLASKAHSRLVEDIGTRLGRVNKFLKRCGPGETVLDVVEIEDAAGPTAWDAEITALTVSRETLAGGNDVNRIRREKGLGELDMFVVNVISSRVTNDDTFSIVDLVGADDGQLKELKMGSTAIRGWMDKNKGQSEAQS